MRSPAWPMLMVSLAGAAIAAGGCTAYPAAPSNPAYDLDVRPILMAHCARCHGAGGTLNVPTEPTGPNAPTIPSVKGYETAFAGYSLYVTQFNDSGNCMLDANGNLPPDCKFGAGTMYVKTISNSVDPVATAPTAMPPAPAPRLNDWEVGVIQNWAKNPICSNSLTPDLAICPHGPGKAM